MAVQNTSMEGSVTSTTALGSYTSYSSTCNQSAVTQNKDNRLNLFPKKLNKK